MPAMPSKNPNSEAPNERKFKKNVDSTTWIVIKNGMIQPNNINNTALISSCFQYSRIIYITNKRSGVLSPVETQAEIQRRIHWESSAGSADESGSPRAG